MPSSTQTAVANGDTRTLNLFHSHTGESIQATFRVNGSYDSAVLEKLNWFLRDWRNNDRTRMDPRLFDVVWEVYRSAGVTEPIVIYSAYRSPETNAMLRRRSSGVAEFSLHMRGMAMDTTLPGMSMEKIREIGMRLQRGGVGYYASSNFVHLDVGNVRSWPRMSYEQLVRLFPDGKTVHLASNGRALPRFEEARAEIAARGGSAGPLLAQNSGGGFFAWLFGNRNEEQEEAEVARQAPTRRGRVLMASANGGSVDDAGGNLAAARGSRSKAADRGLVRPQPGAPPALVASTQPQQEPERPSASMSRPMLASLETSSDQRFSVDQSRAEQSAAAEPEKRDKDRFASVPMPPPRPQDQVVFARAFADVPEPPARPERPVKVAAVASDIRLDPSPRPMATNDPIGDIIGKTKPAEPIARAAGLPVVITQGPKDGPELPSQVLAYAPADQLRDAPLPVEARRGLEPASQASVAPARLDRSNYRGATSQAAIASSPTQSLLAPAFMGLRQAARISPDILSPAPSIGYVCVFAAKATDLDSRRFTGAATKPLEASPGLVHIMESTLRLSIN